MNHALLAGPHDRTRMSPLHLAGRFLSVLKRSCSSLDDPPIHVGTAYAESTRGNGWVVSAALVRQASFGTLSAQRQCWIHAEDAEEALRLGTAELVKDHPEFEIRQIAVTPADRG